MNPSPPSSDASFVVVEDKSRIPTREEPHPSTDAGYIPGSTLSSAHDWSAQSTQGHIKLHGRHFVDGWGRVCLLRGANLSGSSKTPVNHDPQEFLTAHKTVTFVGRPFPLKEAPEHFARLRRWGLTFVRFMVNWEALEHAGPGQYDEEYIDYMRSILELIPQFGLVAFVSMHQDVWSRFSGGSGAPAWTLELVGFDLAELVETGAAYLGGVTVPGVESDRGRWPTGYQKLAASTMWTIFWAGEMFAPKLLVEGQDGKKVHAQKFLQDAFSSCYEHLLERLKDVEGILGFELLNEPHRGYINLPSLHEFDYNTDLHLNDIPSALQSFTLGAGYPTLIPHWVRSFPMPTKLARHNLRNVRGRKVWRADGPTGGRCLWEMHGVWGWDNQKNQGVVLKESYFLKSPQDGKKIDWYRDMWYPFANKWAERVHSIAGQDKIVFLEAIPNEFCPPSWTPEHQPRNMVYAPHWYDLNALFAKAFGNLSFNVQGLSRGLGVHKALYWGHRGARDNYQLQLRNVVEEGYKSLGEKPIFLGECGIPMDMNEKEAFITGNFTWQERMMDALITGLERNLIGFTLWNYNPDNSDTHGDYWNGENFSWFSRRLIKTPPTSLDQSDGSLDAGGRILDAVVRPYPAKVAGIPLGFNYEMNTGSFEFRFANPQKGVNGSPKTASPPLDHMDLQSQETEIFVPTRISKGRRMLVHFEGANDGEYAHHYDPARQTLFLVHRDVAPGRVHQINVSFDPPLEPRYPVEASLLVDLAKYWVPTSAVLLSIVWYFIVPR